MRLPTVTGKEVCRYTESPGLALRVEMPFWSTTPTRVPAGTMTFSPVPACGAGAGFGATGGGASVCGPSCCCAASDMVKSRLAARTNTSLAPDSRVYFITASRMAYSDAQNNRNGCLSTAANTSSQRDDLTRKIGRAHV